MFDEFYVFHAAIVLYFDKNAIIPNVIREYKPVNHKLNCFISDIVLHVSIFATFTCSACIVRFIKKHCPAVLVKILMSFQSYTLETEIKRFM